MRLLSWLASRAAIETTPPRPLPVIAAKPDVAPPSDVPDEEFQIPDDSGKLDLDEVYTIIDYRDARGVETRRRITMQTISAGPHGALLQAICHERHAHRTFRCDRIMGVIDEDGVVEEPNHFFRDVMLIDLSHKSWRSGPDRKAIPVATDAALIQAARDAREHLRAPLSLLVLAATADGHFHPEELDAICQWVEEEMADKARSGEFGLPVLDAMTPLISKMHPTRKSIMNHVRVVRFMDEDRFQRFCKAVIRVIRADGVFSDREREFLEELTALRKGDFETRMAELESEMLR